MGTQYPYSNGGLPQGLNYTPSSGVQFKKGKIDETSQTLDADGDQVNKVLTRTNDTDLAWPGYGLAGLELNGKHVDARNEHAKVLEVAREVLESWRDAFREADRRYTNSDDNSPSNNLPNTNLPNYNLPKADLPNANLPNYNLPNANLTDPNLANPNLANNLADPNLMDPSLANPSLADPSLADPSLADPSLADPSLADPSLANPSLANPNLADPNLADPSLANPNLANPNLANPTLSDPTKTGLSNYDPSTTAVQQPRFPEGPASVDPARSTANSPITTTGTGTGTGSSGLGPGNQVPGLAKGANALGGMGGMPFMPMSPMGAGGDREKEGSGSDLLRGDEEDWGVDEDVAPAVLRHGDA